jgi:CheY-like chemotaxis protein
MLENKKILLIDDDPAVKFLTRYALEKEHEHCSIAEVSDGLEALEMITSGIILPDIILLDLEMPRMNGYEFLIEYKKYGLHKVGISLYVLSTVIDEEVIAKIKSTGVVKKFFEKPLSQKHIHEIVLDFKVMDNA